MYIYTGEFFIFFKIFYIHYTCSPVGSGLKKIFYYPRLVVKDDWTERSGP